MERIFINDYGYAHDWIMGKIADDIICTATRLGYECRCGKFEDYEGEDIVYHLAYHIASPIHQAKHNSVFYTHLNDVLKEINICGLKDNFDSFICMSKEDAQFLVELGFPKEKVFGKTLPVRNTYVKPLSVGIFSACYPDGRKNEQWLVDYCRQCDGAKLINFVFVGKGWDRIVQELEKMGCSFEWHNVSRSLPFEYEFQQHKLAHLNYYIYMGMDGGAMGAYDAYAQDVPLCITWDGFHKSIPDIDYLFDNKESFFKQMDQIITKHSNRINFFKNNNSENYVSWLLDVWNGKADYNIPDNERKCISYNTVVEKKRDQYYPLNMERIRSFISYKIAQYRASKRY